MADFITQVKRPGEQTATIPETRPSSSSSSAEEASSGLFCCFGKSKKKNNGKKTDKDKKNRGDTGGGSAAKSGGVALPLSNLNQRDPGGVNSPRGGLVQSRSGGGPGGNILLGPQRENRKGRKCLVLDLDETLVHSSFQEVARYDFKIPVEIEDVTYTVYVAKRPGVDEFMKKMGEIYEIVIFTASLANYADPVLDLLDIHKVIDWRLFREHCTFVKNSYVKDMGRMGRPINSVMIMDNSPHSYAFNPENAIPCESWFDDMEDRELLDFIPVLQEIAKSDNVITELEARRMNGYSALVGINNSGSEHTSEYYSTTASMTESSWISESSAQMRDSTSYSTTCSDSS
eukprot:TRINITY_DN11525_c0_g1_i1.p1 TRINITY_DN11525_c0_g1~~TRINITY_DN11525_c0_g1_i1.p1  ORF type:complete len:358 (-),score=59.56 TRINITY_DN11525_c0_g1_i1:93-1127(-)